MSLVDDLAIDIDGGGVRIPSLMDLPSELIGEIAQFFNLREFNEWIMLSRKVFERLTSDNCYSQFYWKEINNNCNVKKREIYNPTAWTTYTEIHPLYSKYGSITSNFRNQLIEFKRDFTNNRKHFNFIPIKNMIRIEEPTTIQKKKKQFWGKVIIVGDGFVGKTSLLTRIHSDEFRETQYWHFCDSPTLNYKNLIISLWDTAGQEDYDRLRTLSYPDSSIVLISFSLVSRNSFGNVSRKWIYEVRHHLKDTPIILVGCKHDLREEIINTTSTYSRTNNSDYVRSDEAEELARYLGCLSYWETCSKTKFGMENSLEILVNGCLIGKAKEQPSKKCLIQ